MNKITCMFELFGLLARTHTQSCDNTLVRVRPTDLVSNLRNLVILRF